MAELSEEIAAYETIRADLEAKALGKWAVVARPGTRWYIRQL